MDEDRKMKRLKLKKYVVVSSIIAVNIVLILSAVILNPNKEKELRKLLGLTLTLLVRANAKLGDISFQLDMFTKEVTDTIDKIYEDMQEQSKKDGMYN